ncbi:hypothetical protein T08_13688 [Trichinella sp. T8]|nr:hypothetical protein T08_13688 [Trichinella sp. T8]
MKLKSLPTLKYPTLVAFADNFTIFRKRNFSEIFSKSILFSSVQILDIPGPSTSTVLIKYLCETLLLSYASDGCEYLKHLSF